MKTIWIVLLPFFLVSCGPRDQISIRGSAPESAGLMIYAEKTGTGNPELIDSVMINSSGKFRMNISIKEPEFLQIGFNTRNYVSLLCEPGEKIKLVFNAPFLPQSYQVDGSEGSEEVQILDSKLRFTLRKMDSLTNLYKEHMDDPDFEEMEQKLNTEYQSLIKDQRSFSIQFILSHLHSLASIKALNQQFDDQTFVLYGFKDLQYMKLTTDTLKKYYPESRHVKALTSNLENELSRYNMYRISEMAGDETANFFDIKLPDPQGDSISLSSFIGDYILLSFWTSGSNKSVAENLILKSLYSKYHSKGFEIYQVSFDNDQEEWIRAINYDELPWINVNDLSYPNSIVFNLYNIQSLPANYLLNREGEIIGKDLFGRALQIKMEQLFGS